MASIYTRSRISTLHNNPSTTHSVYLHTHTYRAAAPTLAFHFNLTPHLSPSALYHPRAFTRIFKNRFRRLSPHVVVVPLDIYYTYICTCIRSRISYTTVSHTCARCRRRRRRAAHNKTYIKHCVQVKKKTMEGGEYKKKNETTLKHCAFSFDIHVRGAKLYECVCVCITFILC